MITVTMQTSGQYGNCRCGCGDCGSDRGTGRYTPSTIHINNTVEDYLFTCYQASKHQIMR